MFRHAKHVIPKAIYNSRSIKQVPTLETAQHAKSKSKLNAKTVECLGSCGNREGALGQVAGCNVALAEEADLLRRKCTDN